MSKRLLGLRQIFQCAIVVGLILGEVPVGLRFLQVLILGVGGLGDLLECLVGVRELSVAHPGHCLLHAVSQPVGLVVGVADGFVVLDPCLLLVPHQSIGVALTNLRG